MNKNLLWKLLFILGTMLFFLFGIFGIPKGLSGEALLTSLTDHIHLGLDLKGGTHLILQVHVKDAINVDAQNAMEILKQQLKNRKIDQPFCAFQPQRDDFGARQLRLMKIGQRGKNIELQSALHVNHIEGAPGTYGLLDHVRVGVPYRAEGFGERFGVCR